MRGKTKQRSAKKYFVFMIVLGVLGLLLSWFTLGPQYLLLIPGLSAATTGKIMAVQQIKAIDGPYDYQVATVRFTDSGGQSHTIQYNGNISGTVNVRYLPLRPDFAIAEVSWLDNLIAALQLPCIDLPCLLVAILGIYFYRKYGRTTEATE